MCGVMPPLNHMSERRDAQLIRGVGGSHFLLLKCLHDTSTSVIYKAHAAVFLGIKVFWYTRLCRWVRGSREESPIFRNVGNYLPNDIRVAYPNVILAKSQTFTANC